MSVRAILTTLPYKIKQEKECEFWKSYVAKGVKIISENTAVLCGKQGKYLSVDFDEIINPKPVETRTPEEIISQIKEKINKL